MASPNLQSIAPANRGAVGSKSDGTVLDPTRGILLGAAGTIIVRMANAVNPTDYLTLTLAAGIIHPLTIDQLRTGGTATDITLFW